MMNFNDAIGQQVRLDNVRMIHEQFIDVLQKQSGANIEFGRIDFEDANIFITCLDTRLSFEYRPVSINGDISLIEYSATKIHKKEKIHVYSFYLSENGIIWTDSAQENRLLDYNNSYIVKYILSKISSALRDSVFFKPLK